MKKKLESDTGSNPPTCSRILVSITRVELLALIQINIKASNGNRSIGNEAEAFRLESRAKELLAISESDSENAAMEVRPDGSSKTTGGR